MSPNAAILLKSHNEPTIRLDAKDNASLFLKRAPRRVRPSEIPVEPHELVPHAKQHSMQTLIAWLERQERLSATQPKPNPKHKHKPMPSLIPNCDCDPDWRLVQMTPGEIVSLSSQLVDRNLDAVFATPPTTSCIEGQLGGTEGNMQLDRQDSLLSLRSSFSVADLTNKEMKGGIKGYFFGAQYPQVVQNTNHKEHRLICNLETINPI